MAITQTMCTSFKKALLDGVMVFSSDTSQSFKIALYTSSATLDATTTLSFLKENSLINKNFTRINVDKTKLNELKKKLKQISLDVNISETLIATVSELRDLLVNKDNTSPIFKGWRYKVFGYLFKKL